MSIFGVQTAKATSPTEWTQNSTFIKSGYQWDLILYNWQWSLEPFFGGEDTHEVFTYEDINHALWPQDGVVHLAAADPNALDSYGRSARVTYGPFADTPYPDELPVPLKVTSTNTLTLKGVVSNYGSINLHSLCWTGIKFDAWFRDPLDNNRKMVIEMYFHGTGLQGVWGNEMFRTLGSGEDAADDHIIKLQAFPEYCTITGDIPESNFAWIGFYVWDATQFVIDLKGIWQRAANHFGRSSDDELYAVALDVESGRVLSAIEPVTFAEVNEIEVTYTAPPNTPSTPSGPSSGYRWTSYWYTTSTTDPDGDRIRYQFDWGDGSSEWIQGDYASGEPASWYHRWNSIGSYLIRTRAKDATGLYSSWSPYKRVNIIRKPGFPCPTLFVWNGSEYAEIGVLGIHDDSDITFLQGIDQTFVPEKHLYKLSLRELDEFTSHIDHVKLYAIDNEVGKYECHLAQAVHSELGHVEGLLLHDDDKRVDLNPLQTIDLKFTAPNINEIAYFIFEINGYNIKP